MTASSRTMCLRTMASPRKTPLVLLGVTAGPHRSASGASAQLASGVTAFCAACLGDSAHGGIELLEQRGAGDARRERQIDGRCGSSAGAGKDTSA